MTDKSMSLSTSIAGNLFLITTGCLLFSIALKAIIIPHGFITGGISGLGLLIYYTTQTLSPGSWYLLINTPLFFIGWIAISRRFFLYSLYGMMLLSWLMDFISFQIEITDPFLAILAGGTLIGTGAGIALRSLGSFGGMDIICIILNNRYGVRMGSFLFSFNALLFLCGLTILKLDMVLYSIALSFVATQVLDYVLTLFNQRKMILIISEKHEAIAGVIQNRIGRGATFLNGSGAYTGKEKKIIMTVIHNYQIKRLEEAVMTLDPEAFMITENTFNVLGKGFSKPKVY